MSEQEYKAAWTEYRAAKADYDKAARELNAVVLPPYGNYQAASDSFNAACKVLDAARAKLSRARFDRAATLREAVTA